MSALPHVVADSAAYLSLTTFERAVLAEILRRFNGYNNGRIGISYEELGDRLRGPNTSRPNNGRIGRAIGTLFQRGLIGEPTPGSWVERKAREYRLSWVSSGTPPHLRPATNDYLQWQPELQKNHCDISSPDPSRADDTRSPEGTDLDDQRSPARFKNRSFAAPNRVAPGDAGSSLIYKPYLCPQGGGGSVISGPWRKMGCEDCGQQFEPGRHGMPKRFCSERCRKRAESRRLAQRRRRKFGQGSST
jgi:hypothetical protein